MTFLSG